LTSILDQQQIFQYSDAVVSHFAFHIFQYFLCITSNIIILSFGAIHSDRQWYRLFWCGTT